jgi:hypothetical protein
MKNLFAVLVFISFLFSISMAQAIDKNSILGTWKSIDATTGKVETVIFDGTRFSDGKKVNIPYFVKENGDILEIYLGKRSGPPASFKLKGASAGEVRLPNGRVMAMERISNETNVAVAETQTPKVGKNPLSGVFPNGVATKFEPLGQSMEMLLSSGWELEQISGAQNGMTALLKNGNSNAVCILIPMSMAKGSTAISDCRQLN